MLYVPGGFPHTTDTVTVLEQETIPSEKGSEKHSFDETSVHLTMGLDTHVWALTYAHVRWTLLQRCGKNWKLEIKNDEEYWDSIKSLPIGFLSGGDSDSNGVELAIEGTKKVLMRLEPRRWEKEAFPNDDEIRDVVSYVLGDHLRDLQAIQDEMFSNIDPHDENTIIKGYKCTQKHDVVMQNYGSFSNNEAMKEAFEQRRLAREQKTSTASEL